MRQERDALGDWQIEEEAFYGISTARLVSAITIPGPAFPAELLRNFFAGPPGPGDRLWQGKAVEPAGCCGTGTGRRATDRRGIFSGGAGPGVAAPWRWRAQSRPES